MNRTGHADSFPQNKEWDNNPPKFQAKFGIKIEIIMKIQYIDIGYFSKSSGDKVMAIIGILL